MQFFPAWFDANGQIPSRYLPDKRSGYEVSDNLISDLIQSEVNNGIPLNRIIIGKNYFKPFINIAKNAVLGGFSQGGSYSLHVAYRTHLQLGGCFAIAPFLFNDSIVYESLKANQSSTPRFPKLLVIHGDDDEVMHYEWGCYVYRKLTQLGVSGEFHTSHGVKHEARCSQLLYIEQWARSVLPPLDTSFIHKL